MDIEKTIEDNMGLVYMQLYRLKVINDTEAISHAMEGLWRAAETYSSEANTAFSTYASVCIYNSICKHLRKKRAEQNKPVYSYDAVIDENNETERTYLSLIADHRSPEKQCIEMELYKKTDETIRRLLDEMKESSKKHVIQEWYKSGGALKQRELGERCGVSQSYASRIIGEFRHKLKREMRGYF